MEKASFSSYMDVLENYQAIKHLFEVTVGLDSMILGETQILGQVKDAFQIAQQAQATGTIFNMLFKQAITLAKRAHAQTEIGQHAVSVSYAAIELARKIYGDLNRKSALIIGAGKMSELTAKHLFSQGVSHVYVVNRTFSRALELASRFQGEALPLEALPTALNKVDIVISSTGAPGYVIDKQMMKQVMKHRFGKPIFLIDIAVPRDMDPNIEEIDNAYLFDIDDLKDIVQSNLGERQKEAEKISVMIAEEMNAFKDWLNTLGVVPIVTALREKALAIQQETMNSIENKCPDLSERELRVLRKHTKSIINQLLRDPILRAKEMAVEPHSKELLALFTNIFALEEEVQKQEKKAKAAQYIEETEQEFQHMLQEKERTGVNKLPVQL
jgi:glutamyl-tRNA reductase